MRWVLRIAEPDIRAKLPPPWTLVIFVFLVVTFFPFVNRRASEWDEVYFSAAQNLRAGAGLYTWKHAYVYPPFSAALTAPLTILPRTAARAAWFACNAWALIVLIRATWRLSGGANKLPGWDAPRSEHLIMLLALGCGGYYIHDAIAHQQTDLVIAALLVQGCLYLQNERAFRAATLFAIATSFKCTPLLFLPYLIWRGKFLASVWMGIVMIGANLIPDLICPSPWGDVWLIVWWKCFIAPMLSGQIVSGVWASNPIYNQSLSGALYRWTQTTWHGSDGTAIPLLANAISFATLKQIERGVQILMIVAGTFVLWHRPFRSLKNGPSLDGIPRSSFECSLLLVLMLLLAPMSSKPHFLTLLLPGACLARLAMQKKKSGAGFRTLLGVAIFLGLFMNKDLVQKRLYDLGLWFGLVMFSAIILGAMCGAVLLRMKFAKSAIGGQVDENLNERRSGMAA